MGMERCQKWNSYLRNETNKIELLRYLSGVIAQSNFDESKVVEASQGAFPGADPGGGGGDSGCQDPPFCQTISYYCN